MLENNYEKNEEGNVSNQVVGENVILEDNNDTNLNNNPQNKKGIVLKIIILLVLLIASAWLIVFFFSEDESEDVLSNLNLNNSVNVLETVNTEVEKVDEVELADSQSSTTLVDKAKPITVINDDYRMSLEAPEQSVVIPETEIPAGSVTIIGNDDGFSPDIFYASPGQEITLTLSAKAETPVVLTFYDERMAAVAIGCSPGTTRFVKFTAPNEAGEYLFINDVFGKREQQGKMIVR